MSATPDTLTRTAERGPGVASDDTSSDASPLAGLVAEPVGGALVREPEAASADEDATGGEGAGEPAPAVPYGVAALYGSPDNPVPPGVAVGTVTTEDGVVLRTAIFRATRRPLRGTIVLLQGRNECIEKYFETAADLTGLGHAVLAFDWRGQGGSQRLLADPMRGHVRSFRDYGRDLDAVLTQVALPDCRPPFTLVGHSMGGLLALLHAPRLGASVERIVALAPMLRLVEQPLGQRGLKWAMGLLRALGLGRLYAAGGPRPREVPDFMTNILTTDPARHERNGTMFVTHPHLALGGPTVAWVHAACTAMDRALREHHLRAVRTPSLLIAAGDDAVVSTPAQERLVRRMRNANLVTVDGARHEMLQERERYRAQVLAAIAAFAATPAEGS